MSVGVDFAAKGLLGIEPKIERWITVDLGSLTKDTERPGSRTKHDFGAAILRIARIDLPNNGPGEPRIQKEHPSLVVDTG